MSALLDRRNIRAQTARDILRALPAEWHTPRTEREPRIGRDEYLHICELILANPTQSAQEIAGRQGKRGEWLNTRMRQMRTALDLV